MSRHCDKAEDVVKPREESRGGGIGSEIVEGNREDRGVDGEHREWCQVSGIS